MTVTPYNRRPAPEQYQKAWVDLETAHIKAALDSAQAGAGSTTVFLAADVSNSAAATNQPTGLKADVLSGSIYTFRWFLWFNSNTNTGGVVPAITHPAYTAALTHHRGNTSGVGTLTESINTVTANPVTTATYVSYSGVGVVMIEHTLVASANGTVELVFHPNTNTQNYTLKAGSYLEVFGPA